MDHSTRTFHQQLDALHRRNGELEATVKQLTNERDTAVRLAGHTAPALNAKIDECDLLRQQNRVLLKVAQGQCPECGAHDLHSASLANQPAISCCECDWISAYAALGDYVAPAVDDIVSLCPCGAFRTEDGRVLHSASCTLPPQAQEFAPGDLVRYVPMHARGNASHPDCQTGTVSSVTEQFVFVRFGMGETGQACSADSLVLMRRGKA